MWSFVTKAAFRHISFWWACMYKEERLYITSL